MITRIKKAWSDSKKFEVEIIQGNQSFTLDYVGTMEECVWYAKMFRKAMRSHDKARDARRAKL